MMKKNFGLALIFLYSLVLIIKGCFALCCYEFESVKNLTEIVTVEDHCVHHHNEKGQIEKSKQSSDCTPCYEINKNIYWAFQKNLKTKTISPDDSFDYFIVPELAFNNLFNGKQICFNLNDCFIPSLNESGNPPVYRPYSTLLRI